MNRLLITAVAASVAIVGCSREDIAKVKSSVTVRDTPAVGHSPAEGLNAPNVTALKEKQQEIAREMRQALDDLNVKVDDLRKRADTENTNSEARADLNRRLEIARQKRDAARQRLDELTKATADRWDKAKVAMQRALDDLRTAFD